MTRHGRSVGCYASLHRDLRRATFTLENRTGDRHATMLAFAPPGADDCREIRADGRTLDLKPNANTDDPLRAEMVRR